MKIGDEVRATGDITGWTQAFVPKDAVGIVTHVAFGRLDVSFTVAGVLGGTRRIPVTVDPDQITPT
jgi:hypothetical protein